MNKKSVWKIGGLTALLVGAGFMYQTTFSHEAEQENPVHASDEYQEGTLVVSGEGTVTMEPDLAFVQFGVEETHDSADKAQEAVSERINTVRDRLSNLGIEEDQLETVRFNVHPYQPRTGQGEESEEQFRAQHILEVEYQDIENVGVLLDEVADAGANRIERTQFTLEDESEAEQQAIKKAIDHTKPKAAAMAESAGKQQGEVLHITDRDARIDIPVQNHGQEEMAYDDAGTDRSTVIDAGEIEVVQHVDVVYELTN
ncbi:SIMPL domain-containing protein [Texcoconibacillus texcoconensis]|uniref:DUF541 domain-containing protein n=1 Tax=Texcoconibacillus texcoconensis TaxID=1095777 RepID=A0A840QLT5_9BACI|nr:SIMPL domain-containing protein [Texcoconibacillus texcoconensis]MBB5172313.1 hypothetical protein [Texcoconibacillus texcoconensis]